MQPLIVIDPADLQRAVALVVGAGFALALSLPFALFALGSVVRAVAVHIVGPVSRIRSARERALQSRLERLQQSLGA